MCVYHTCVYVHWFTSWEIEGLSYKWYFKILSLDSNNKTVKIYQPHLEGEYTGVWKWNVSDLGKSTQLS